jgi:hypothetical protein
LAREPQKIPQPKKKRRKAKKQEGEDKDEIVTIESDKEEEEKEDDSVDVEEFLLRYNLSQFEESFKKNQLNTPAFRLLCGKDLKDMGFTPEDVVKWKKFNPDLTE